MIKNIFSKALFGLALVAMLSSTHAASLSQIANDGVVKIVAGSRGGTYTQLTTEMMSVLPEYAKGGPVRVVPMIGVGSKQNIQDLLYLKGVDIALMQNDVLTDYAQDKGGSVKNRVRYIAKLHEEEFHLLARADINNIEDLNGKKVSFGAEGSGTSLTANAIFSRLDISPEIVYRGVDDSIRALKAGEIQAMAYVAGKPVSALLNRISKLDDVHFLTVVDTRLRDYYSPTRLSSIDYPNLIESADVPTVKVDAILAVFNFPKNNERYTNINRFTESLVAAMDELKSGRYHPKWRTINPCAEVPGWTRHAIMQEVCGDTVEPEAQPVAAAQPAHAAQAQKSIEEKRDLLVKYYVNSGFSQEEAELVVASYDDNKINSEYSRLIAN